MIRDDIGPDLTENNPVEELNKLEGPAGQYYGYPRCFSAGNNTAPTLYADPNYLKQYAWPTFMNTTTDEWCQNETNNRKPLMGIIAHSSPIQMRFVSDEDGCEKTSDSIPCSWKGDLLATLHGSWNRKTPAGYAVVRIPFLNGNPQASKIQYLAETQNFQTACNTNAQNNQQNYKCFRPAGITIKDGVIYVSSGITNDIVQLKYDKRRADLAGTGRISLYSSIILGLVFVFTV